MNGRLCEGRTKEGRACGGPAYSWSTEHNNKVLCVSCYEDWLATKNVSKARDILSGLTAEEKKQLVKELSA